MDRDTDGERDTEAERSSERSSVAAPDDEPTPAVVRSFVEAVPTPMLVCDPITHAIRAANEPAVDLLDRDVRTLTLMGLTDIGDTVTTVDGGRVDAAADAAVDGGGVTSFEWDVGGPRSRFRLELSLHTTVIADQEWLIVALTDVTDRVSAREGVRSQRRVTDAISSTVPAALFQCTADGTLARWNERLATDAGYTKAELSGRALTRLFTDESRGAVAQAVQSVYGRGERTTCEATLFSRSGTHVPYRLTLGPITDGDEVVGAVGIGEDVTDASLREERLAVLTRVLRHNFRNDLNVVTGFTQHVLEEIDDARLVEKLERVTDTAERLIRAGEMSRRVERLLADRPMPTEIRLAPTVEEALASLPAELRDSAAIETDVPEGVTVSAVGYLAEAIEELVDNAIRHNESDRPRVRVTATELPSRSWASLVVSDDGPGIPPAERSVLTGEETPLKHASGLGLWYVNWIIDAGGGSFDIAESNTGGSRIEIDLRTPDDE